MKFMDNIFGHKYNVVAGKSDGGIVVVCNKELGTIRARNANEAYLYARKAFRKALKGYDGMCVYCTV